MNIPKYVKMVEVGPHDGLQNESKCVTTASKIGANRTTSGGGLASSRGYCFRIA